jgi:hypothetical protein
MFDAAQRIPRAKDRDTWYSSAMAHTTILKRNLRRRRGLQYLSVSHGKLGPNRRTDWSSPNVERSYGIVNFKRFLLAA